MNVLRKLFGLLVILFLGLPILFAVVIAVGVTQAAASPQLYSELPPRIVAEVPALVDEVVTLSQSEAIMDSNSRAWLRAAAAVPTRPHAVLEETGMLAWLRGELTRSLGQIGRILRGEAAVQPVKLDMRPLKRALQHDAVARYLGEVMEKLPPCDETGTAAWREIVEERRCGRDLPACRPAEGTPDLLLERMHADVARDIPDEVELVEFDRDFPRHIGFMRTAMSAVWLAFLAPALFIGLGAAVAADSRASFLRWFGISTGIGGLLSLGFSLMIERVVPWAIRSGQIAIDGTLVQIREVALERAGNLVQVTAKYFVGPVTSTAEIVCVVGLVIFALSYLVGGSRPAPVAPPPPPAA